MTGSLFMIWGCTQETYGLIKCGLGENHGCVEILLMVLLVSQLQQSSDGISDRCKPPTIVFYVKAITFQSFSFFFSKNTYYETCYESIWTLSLRFIIWDVIYSNLDRVNSFHQNGGSNSQDQVTVCYAQWILTGLSFNCNKYYMLTYFISHRKQRYHQI